VDTFHVKMTVFVKIMDFVSVEMDSMEQHAQVINFDFFIIIKVFDYTTCLKYFKSAQTALLPKLQNTSQQLLQ
jgi:hypothetical protein